MVTTGRVYNYKILQWNSGSDTCFHKPSKDIKRTYMWNWTITRPQKSPTHITAIKNSYSKITNIVIFASSKQWRVIWKSSKIAALAAYHPLLLMAPRRNNSGHTALDVHNLLGLEPDTLDTNHNQQSGLADNFTRCCVPTGDCFKLGTLEFGLISLDNLRDSVRVICNNENCTSGQYMHRECFEAWEEGVLTYLKTIGRARSWSDRQRQQNLWTKKGYDLVFKACTCKCGRGHLKKDTDWTPPSTVNHSEEEATKKKKKKNRNNQKPTLAISSISFHNPAPTMASVVVGSQINNHHNGNNGINGGNAIGVIGNHQHSQHSNGNHTIGDGRDRTASLSSSNDGSSSPSASSDMSISPIHNGSIDPKKQKSRVELYSERIR